MRSAVLRKPARDARQQRVSGTVELPAPVGGLNARDSIAQMKETDAIILDNYVCTTTDVAARDGYAEYATGIAGKVRSLIVYNANSGGSQMFAASGPNIYDSTDPGAIGAPVVTGATSDKWQYINFATSGGTFIQIVNGSDAPYNYDGSTWNNPIITGVTPSDIININVFKSRIWYILKSSLTAAYLPATQIAGAASIFDLRPIFKGGGYLVAMATWTVDGGIGIDDYAAFITSEGEVAVYQGTDPASASTFALRGVYQVGNPIGYRCADKYGGDVVLITRDGLAPLSKAIVTDRFNNRYTLTDKINQRDRKSTRLNSSHIQKSRMPSSA